MNENQRANIFRSEWKAFWPEDHVLNIPDAPRGQQKPYDGLAVHDSMFIGIEFKRVTGQSINGNMMRDNQVVGLLEAQHSGFAGLVIVFMEHADWQMKKLFVMPIKKFMKTFGASYMGSGKYSWGVSMKIKELEESHACFFIERSKQELSDGTKKKIWDFTTIIEKICYE